jgi:hypothetical protein
MKEAERLSRALRLCAFIYTYTTLTYLFIFCKSVFAYSRNNSLSESGER